MTANALFYQFGDEYSQLSTLESLMTRAIVGALSSLIVFVPTTIIGLLFKHTRPRHFVPFDPYSRSDDLGKTVDVRGPRFAGRVRSGAVPRLIRRWLFPSCGPRPVLPGNLLCQAQLVPAGVPGLVLALVGRHSAVLHHRGRVAGVLLQHAALRYQVW